MYVWGFSDLIWEHVWSDIMAESQGWRCVCLLECVGYVTSLEDTCIILEEIDANQQVWALDGTLKQEKKIKYIMSGLGCLNVDGL